MTSADADPVPRALLEGKAERLLTHCVYRIATGRWPGGTRLPSVREVEATWGLDRRTVMKAYRRLEELGLAEARPRSGTFVREGPAVGRLGRHRHALEALFERCAAIVAEETDLSLEGAFRYFAQLAAMRARERPECAFVECTSSQAEGHAREVAERLGVACLGLTLEEIDGRAARVPPWLRTLFVSGFHLGELRSLEAEAGGRFRVQAVPIEVSPEVTADPGPAREGVLLESDAVEADHMRDDVAALGFELPLEARTTDDLEGDVARLAADPRRLVLLSPRLWGRLGEAGRGRANVRPVAFRVAEEGWPTLADALGLPLGDVAG